MITAFLLSWSEDLKLRGEHRGPRLERTAYLLNYLTSLNFIVWELIGSPVRTGKTELAKLVNMKGTSLVL